MYIVSNVQIIFMLGGCVYTRLMGFVSRLHLLWREKIIVWAPMHHA